MDRLPRKHQAAAEGRPGARSSSMQTDATFGIISLGGCDPAVREAVAVLARARHRRRLHAHPRASRSATSVEEFLAAHERIFVVEQNRDAQLALAADARDRRRQGASCARCWSTAASRCRAATWSTASPASCERSCQHAVDRKPAVAHPHLQPNKLGLTLRDYEGAMSTLCAGCGHDSVTAAIVRAFYELDTPPHMIAKLSGIGCSSKTPTYFVSGAHGFNSAHGRMPSIATGANAANRDADLHRHLGRRRLAVDRPRPAGPRHPPQPQHALRHREQRRLRPDQGAVLGVGRRRLEEQARRGEPLRAHRSGARWRSTWARPSWRAASRATRRSWCRS